MTRTEGDGAERDLFDAWVAGEIGDDDPVVRALFESDPELRDEWVELRQLSTDLDRAGDADEAELREVLARRGEWNEQAIIAADSAAADSAAAASSSHREHGHRRLWWVALAACVLLGVGIGIWIRDGAADPPEDLFLLPESAMLPDELFSAEEQLFEWGFPRESGASFEFRIFDGDTMIYERVDLFENRWKLTSEVLSTFPVRVKWVLSIRPATGPSEELGSRELRRSD